MLHLGPGVDLGISKPVGQLIEGIAFVQGLVVARVHCNMPCHFRLGIGAFGDASVSGIAMRVHFLPLQPAVAFEHIVNMAGCAPHGVHQARLSVRANVGTHAKVPLFAFLAGVHLKVAGFVVALGLAGRRNACAVTTVPVLSSKPRSISQSLGLAGI